MHVIDIIEDLIQSSCLSQFQKINDQIIYSLNRIQTIANKKYSNKSQSGNSALNRSMLLDKDIADLLTVEVIRYLFSNADSDKYKLQRLGGSKVQTITIKDAIYYGFSCGLEIIRTMPNNSVNAHGFEGYKSQNRKFQMNTCRIIEAIKCAAGYKGDINNIKKEKINFSLIFENIKDSIDILKKNGLSMALLHCNGYSTNQMRMQARLGFDYLCRSLKVKRKIINDSDVNVIELDTALIMSM